MDNFKSIDKEKDLEFRPFSAINLADPFFDSLKAAYPEFEQWYAKKAAAGEKAYVFFFDDGRVAVFTDAGERGGGDVRDEPEQCAD